MNARELEDRHGSGLYPKKPLSLLRGSGSRVWDEEGREFLDFTAGHGVVNLGHAHPGVAAAVARQMSEIVTLRESFYHPRRGELYARLSALAGGGLERVFLCNSGTEANECALKMARLLTGRRQVVAARRGFHGRTMGALSVTWEKKYREPFEPLVSGTVWIGYNKTEELEQAITAETAAVILEPVQGEGGVHPARAEFLRAAQELCRARGAFLVLDEVQTGMGRTGRLFAKDHAGIEPDLLVLGKGLAGGLPVGAVLFGHRVPTLPPLSHGSTFGGGPVVVAAAMATLDALEDEGLVDNAARMGERLAERLGKMSSPLIREVRGLGLMLGIELKRRAAGCLEGLLRRGVLALAAGPSVVRFLPPLCVTAEEVERAASALEEALADAVPARDEAEE